MNAIYFPLEQRLIQPSTEADWQLTSAPSRFEQAMGEAQQALNLPPRHARLVLLAAAASVYQGHQDVRLPDGSVTSLSLTAALQGASGPACMFYSRLLNKTCRVMTDHMSLHPSRLKAHSKEWSYWQRQYEDLLAHKDYHNISELMECQPSTPRLLKTHYQQMPWEEVHLGLQRNVPCAAWLVSEQPGKLALKSLVKDPIFLSLINEATPTNLTTLVLCKKEESHRHVPFGVMPQTVDTGAPYILHAGIADDYMTGDTPHSDTAMPATQALEARFAKQYRHNLVLAFAPGMTKATLEFCPSAKIYWRTQLQAHGAIQGRQALIAQVDDTITPWGRTVARVAALLHLIEGGEGDISDETLHRANLICCPPLSDDVSPVLATTALRSHDVPRRLGTVHHASQANRRVLPIRRPQEACLSSGERSLTNVR